MIALLQFTFCRGICYQEHFYQKSVLDNHLPEIVQLKDVLERRKSSAHSLTHGSSVQPLHLPSASPHELFISAGDMRQSFLVLHFYVL
ncbi:hypothetical protein E2C01_051501 [Portunus trituberculatus]|uniref:Uncharacterized protein n=1 Tax=Portunus trituberculatus TaxID=210409 RepID=A0A5B7GB56_PORTR|nr:hypothetical protein [Portunus trituberculatus]